jgi:hypothetical protein
MYICVCVCVSDYKGVRWIGVVGGWTGKVEGRMIW